MKTHLFNKREDLYNNKEKTGVENYIEDFRQKNKKEIDELKSFGYNKINLVYKCDSKKLDFIRIDNIKNYYESEKIFICFFETEEQMLKELKEEILYYYEMLSVFRPIYIMNPILHRPPYVLLYKVEYYSSMANTRPTGKFMTEKELKLCETISHKINKLQNYY